MILRRNIALQYVELGPIRDASGNPITSGVSAFVNNAAGAGTLVHRAVGIWGYTFTQAETDAELVALRLTAAGGGIAQTFVALAITAGGFVNATVNALPPVTLSQIQDREGDLRPIEPPASDAYRLDTYPLSQMLNVLPGRDRGLPQSNRGRIVVAQGELITISRQVVDGNGAAVNLSGRTLQFIIQDARGVDVAVVPHSSITVSGTGNSTYSFAVPTAGSARVGNFSYWLNDLGASKAELARGDWIVEARPLADS